MDKIALFLPSLAGGGAERAMVELANGLAASGRPVDLVLASATGPFLGEVDGAVNVVDLGTPRISRSVRALAAYLRRARPAVLLSAMSHANVSAVIAARLARVGVRVVVCEQAIIARFTDDPGGWKDGALKHAVRLAYRRADAVVGVSEALADEMVAALKLDPAKVFAIANPLVSDRLLARAAEPAGHPWLAEGPPVVLSVGRLSREKDYATLIRGFARMRRPARLIILGEGEERAGLEALVAELGLGDRVALPGFDPNPFAYMSRAGLFVLSSLNEGLPSVLIQAMACGAPVISTDCPTGPREILADGRWGGLVPPGDPALLGEAMDAALARTDHPDARLRAAEYSVDAAVRRYLALLLP